MSEEGRWESRQCFALVMSESQFHFLVGDCDAIVIMRGKRLRAMHCVKILGLKGIYDASP